MKKLSSLLLVAVFCLSLFAVVSCNKGNDKVVATVKVDANITGESGSEVNGVKTFKTVTEAVNHFIANNAEGRKVIEISAGTYNEKIYIPKEVTDLALVGSSSAETKITYGDFASKKDENGVELGTDKTATLSVLANGFSASNIFFENSFDYMNSYVANKQALAGYVKADKVVFNKCSFTGHQDTLEAVSGRQYYKDCFIYGHTDFIFGNNSASLFENCEIKTRYRNNSNGGYITATKGNNGTNGQGVPKFGFVFMSCNLTADEGVNDVSASLGRPWRADATVSYLNCEIGKHIAVLAFDGMAKWRRYVSMNGGGLTNEPQNAHFTEYNNTGAGSITEAVNGCTMLTSEQASEYTHANIFATTNGMVTYEGEWDADASLNSVKALVK